MDNKAEQKNNTGETTEVQEETVTAKKAPELRSMLTHNAVNCPPGTNIADDGNAREIFYDDE